MPQNDDVREVEVWLHTLLTSTLMKVSAQLQVSTALLPGTAPPPCTHSTVDWVGPMAHLDAAEKSLLSLQRIEPRLLGRPAPRQSLCRLTYPRSGCGQFQGICRRSVGEAHDSHEQFHSEETASGASSQTTGRSGRGKRSCQTAKFGLA
jgi:hypothetical protein